jgi:hypothetical protein
VSEADVIRRQQQEIAWLRELLEFRRRFAATDAETREVLISSAVLLERLRAAQERRRRRRWFC